MQKQKEAKTLLWVLRTDYFNSDSAKSQNLEIFHAKRGSILEIKSWFCETSDEDRT